MTIDWLERAYAGLVVGTVAVAMTPLPSEIPPSISFVRIVDWYLVGIMAVFGFLGALPRYVPPFRAGQQLTSGIVGGMVVGLWSAEMEWFIHAPRALLVMAILGGYAGTAILDVAVARLTKQSAGASHGN